MFNCLTYFSPRIYTETDFRGKCCSGFPIWSLFAIFINNNDDGEHIYLGAESKIVILKKEKEKEGEDVTV